MHRDLQFKTKARGQTICFISQCCPGRHTHTCCTQDAAPSELGMKRLHLPSLQETAIWLASALTAHCIFALPKVHSAVLLVSHIVNSMQRFAFCINYFEHSPSNVPRLTDTTVHFTSARGREITADSLGSFPSGLVS